jgi:hypothetical protein
MINTSNLSVEPDQAQPKPVADSGRLVDEGSTHEDSVAKGAWEAFVETGGD